MNSTTHTVFVYGTLKPGGHYWARFCEGKVSEVLPAKIRGSLYDLGVGYPGLVLDDQGWVQGCLLMLPREADFQQLDVLEGYVPQREASKNEYVRLKVSCFDPDGESLGEFWAYEMTAATMKRHKTTLIENGNWPI
ncbi:MAG: gamma-glutamylcyclotransferase family protein [Lentimonas sp.]